MPQSETGTRQCGRKRFWPARRRGSFASTACPSTYSAGMPLHVPRCRLFHSKPTRCMAHAHSDAVLSWRTSINCMQALIRDNLDRKENSLSFT